MVTYFVDADKKDYKSIKAANLVAVKLKISLKSLEFGNTLGRKY